MSVTTEKNLQQIDMECNVLLSAKKIIVDYYSNYATDSNASKLDEYVHEIDSDLNNPFFEMKDNIKKALKTMDMLIIIKQSKLLNLN